MRVSIFYFVDKIVNLWNKVGRQIVSEVKNRFSIAFKNLDTLEILIINITNIVGSKLMKKVA